MAKVKHTHRRGRPQGKTQKLAAKTTIPAHKSKKQKLASASPAPLRVKTGPIGAHNKRRPRIIVTVLGPEDETPKALVASEEGLLQTFNLGSEEDHASEQPLLQILAPAGTVAVPTDANTADISMPLAASTEQVQTRSGWSWLAAPFRSAAGWFA